MPPPLWCGSGRAAGRRRELGTSGLGLSAGGVGVEPRAAPCGRDRVRRDADSGPVPTPFVAVTVNVYSTPFVSPAIVIDGSPVLLADRPPGDAVAV